MLLDKKILNPKCCKELLSVEVQLYSQMCFIAWILHVHSFFSVALHYWEMLDFFLSSQWQHRLAMFRRPWLIHTKVKSPAFCEKHCLTEFPFRFPCTPVLFLCLFYHVTVREHMTRFLQPDWRFLAENSAQQHSRFNHESCYRGTSRIFAVFSQKLLNE